MEFYTTLGFTRPTVRSIGSFSDPDDLDCKHFINYVVYFEFSYTYGTVEKYVTVFYLQFRSHLLINNSLIINRQFIKFVGQTVI